MSKGAYTVFRFTALVLLLCGGAHGQPVSTGEGEVTVVSGSGPIARITIEGNKKTKREIISQELLIGEGAPFDAGDIEESRQNIMNLGLFKSVKMESRNTPDGVEVTFIVDEKRFWYAVPVFSRGSDGDITYGARLQMDNLFGQNNKLTILTKRTDFEDTDLQTEESYELEYYYPRVAGSEYDLGLFVDHDEADIEEERGPLEGDYLREKNSFGIRIAKWLSTTGPSKGLRFKLGFLSEDYEHEFLRGDPNLFTDLRVNTIRPGLEYVDVTDHGAYRSGVNYGFNYAISSGALGSDIQFMEYDLYYRKYLSLDPVKMKNLNLQFRIGMVTESRFGDATYQVTGGTTVRGYERDSIEGDAFYIANAEYLQPVFGKETLRGALFIDVGDAFPAFKNMGESSPKVGVGAGLRWKIQSFVRTDLRLDIARGLGSDGDLKIYAGTSATF